MVDLTNINFSITIGCWKSIYFTLNPMKNPDVLLMISPCAIFHGYIPLYPTKKLGLQPFLEGKNIHIWCHICVCIYIYIYHIISYLYIHPNTYTYNVYLNIIIIIIIIIIMIINHYYCYIIILITVIITIIIVVIVIIIVYVFYILCILQII